MMVLGKSVPDFYCQDSMEYGNSQLSGIQDNDMVMFLLLWFIKMQMLKR